MSACRHTAPLVALLRFGGGEIDERAQRHVQHLEFCVACQAAIADDRALTRQLERALRARVDGYAPTSAAWTAVERRIAAEPPRWRARWARWLTLPAGGLASAGAMAALSLVLVVSGQGGASPAGSTSGGSDAARTTLPLSGTPTLETARLPAEQLDAPAPPNLASVVMEAIYTLPGDAGGKLPPDRGNERAPSGGVIVAFAPAADPE